jgi:integrase/recombinase XerD
MTTAAPSHALATIQPVFTDSERLALAGFLAGYRSLTCDAYALDLRQFTAWCRARSLSLFAVRRADIEGFARDLEARGRARATVTRRLCTIAGSYKYAVEEVLLDHSPAAHARRPRVRSLTWGATVAAPITSRTLRRRSHHRRQGRPG